MRVNTIVVKDYKVQPYTMREKLLNPKLSFSLSLSLSIFPLSLPHHHFYLYLGWNAIFKSIYSFSSSPKDKSFTILITLPREELVWTRLCVLANGLVSLDVQLRSLVCAHVISILSLSSRGYRNKFIRKVCFPSTSYRLWNVARAQ